MKKNKKNQVGSTLLAWFMLILIITISFALNATKIKKVLQETRFLEVVFGVPVPEDDRKDLVQVQKDEAPLIVQSNEDKIEPLTAGLAEAPVDVTTVTTSQVEETKPESTIVEIATTVNTKKITPGAKTQMTKLYFVVIEGDGRLVRKDVNRLIPQTEAPLSGTIKSLLQGPDIEDVEKGYISLIPSEAGLISANIQNKVAFLNFNDAFQFNNYGVNGYLGQLMQIVFTTTEFPSIESVQFLIDGQVVDYLGGEGVWIGSPLSRSTFR